MPLSKQAAEDLDRKPFLEKMTAVLRIGRSAMGLAGRIGEFFRVRNESLLEKEMGLGEYTYIYAIAYYTYLGHSPFEGPAGARLAGDADDGDNIEMMGPRLRSRIRADLLRMIENQLAALPEGASPPIRDSLAAEIEAMKQDPVRFPWKDGLPDAIRASLDPWRGDLEETWATATNGFELGINRRRGKHSYTAE
jgi:hypothetical protein